MSDIAHDAVGVRDVPPAEVENVSGKPSWRRMSQDSTSARRPIAIAVSEY